MKILALDTSTMMATCAVLDENRVLGEYSLNQEFNHISNGMYFYKISIDNYVKTIPVSVVK